jgi:hypothetical protein
MKSLTNSMHRIAFTCAAVVVASLGLLAATPVSASETTGDADLPRPETAPRFLSTLRSPEDGWLDASEFLDQAYGFMPIVLPITEPAVGFGAAGALAFIDRPKGKTEDGYGRPNITVVGGLLTENDTKGVMVGDWRHWLGGRLQTLIGGIRASVNLDFFGIGQDVLLQDNPLSYNIEMSGGMAQAKYRLGNSRFWAGLGYAYATTQVTFDAPSAMPGLPDFPRETRLGGLTPSFGFDSRDNIFTPIRGTYFDSSVGLFSHKLGSDHEFQRVNLIAMQFLPLDPKLTFGVRAGAALSLGDVPFYLRPFVQLRGAPMMRYQGEGAAQVEAELRWQFWKRFSLVGFAGAGAAWNDRERLENTTSVVTGGGGIRYELARKHGLHMGLDVATGPAGPAIYVQIGSAWVRP